MIHYKILFLFILVMLHCNSAVGEETSSRYSLAWKTSLANDNFTNTTDSSNLVKTSLGFQAGMKLLDTLSLDAEFNFYWSTGRAQSWYGADGYSTGLNFNQAVIKFNPLSVLEFQAGAISLRYLNSPLLVSSGPFPGVLAKLYFGENQWVDFGLTGLYSLPTSRSLNSDRIEKEVEPSFITLSFDAKTGKQFDLVGGDVLVSFYKYQNLPSKVAYESSLKGNTTKGETDADSSFRFEFGGISAGIGGFATFFENYIARVRYTYLLNTDGHTVANRGELLQMSVDIPLEEDLFVPFIELFYSEADASVAYYNSTLYGNNNRQGYSVGMSYEYHELFKLKFRYTSADLIYVNNMLSSHNQMLFVGIETSFVDIL